jgi:hypothetical protein
VRRKVSLTTVVCDAQFDEFGKKVEHVCNPHRIKALEDCKAAVRWLRAHADEFGIDPNRIGVWGASAGAYLASLLGTTGETQEFDVGENVNYSRGRGQSGTHLNFGHFQTMSPRVTVSVQC